MGRAWELNWRRKPVSAAAMNTTLRIESVRFEGRLNSGGLVLWTGTARARPRLAGDTSRPVRRCV
jgi:hypothetical protein